MTVVKRWFNRKGAYFTALSTDPRPATDEVGMVPGAAFMYFTDTRREVVWDGANWNPTAIGFPGAELAEVRLKQLAMDQLTGVEGAVLKDLLEVLGIATPEQQVGVIALASMKVTVADVVSVSMRMDQAVNGLAGYIIEVEIADTDLLKFTDVIFPPEFPLTSTAPNPPVGFRVELRAVDLGGLIQDGATDILLATLKVEALLRGIAHINMTVKQLDDDDGNPIPFRTRRGVITVTG